MAIFVLLLMSSACFLSFGWALGGHFRKDGGMKLGMRLLSLFSVLAYAAFVARLLALSAEPAVAIIAACFFAWSMLLFWWTIRTTRTERLSLAHSDASPAFFLDRGPYALVRHPFYLSYLVFWFGTAVAAGRLQWVPVAVLAVWYVAIARREEKRFASSALVMRYDVYRRRTGMLVPKWRLPARAAPWADTQFPHAADCEVSTSVR